MVLIQRYDVQDLKYLAVTSQFKRHRAAGELNSRTRNTSSKKPKSFSLQINSPSSFLFISSLCCDPAATRNLSTVQYYKRKSWQLLNLSGSHPVPQSARQRWFDSCSHQRYFCTVIFYSSATSQTTENFRLFSRVLLPPISLPKKMYSAQISSTSLPPSPLSSSLLLSPPLSSSLLLSPPLLLSPRPCLL